VGLALTSKWMWVLACLSAYQLAMAAMGSWLQWVYPWEVESVLQLVYELGAVGLCSTHESVSK